MVTKAPAKKTAAKKAAPRRAPAKLAAVDEDDYGTENATPTPVEDSWIDYKRAPDIDEDVAVDPDLEFSTDSGNRGEVEKLLIKLNGRPHYLFKPSTASLLFAASAIMNDNAKWTEVFRTMLNTVDQCIDDEGSRVIMAAIYKRDNSFDETLIPKLFMRIVNQWAPDLADDLDIDDGREVEPRNLGNRAQRRQAARSR
ncbi:hypothetical protein JVX90_00315 [Gordonia sp. PDNC005]|uniref:hypothetical protein n=1 Tax=Gordonia sp. PDNC005 TaxID=2811424 RepID=UPI001963BE1A|nr:hypothetical protein [Gordonia sp. PDNC005]QRY62756.1 hypothetical protein JVX90_00315 [Gordonia sp. PDNC005]